MVYHGNIELAAGTGHVQEEAHHSQRQFQGFCIDTNMVDPSLLQSYPLYRPIPGSVLAAVNHEHIRTFTYTSILVL
jgi:hypothetical protein